ncbi:MAG: ATP-binding protein [Bacilli bacterium]
MTNGKSIPPLWDAVRAEVDFRDEKGQFILTGSSTPSRKGILHSGIGRIHTLQMKTMSLYESLDSTGEVSLLSLFDNEIENSLIKQASLEELIELVVKGGWPSNFKVDPKHYGEISKHYLNALLEEDIHKIDDIARDKSKFEALLRSLARNESTLAGNNVLLNDINKYEEESLSRNALIQYIDVLERLFIIENQNAFNPNYRSSTRVARVPKRHFVDPSLAVAALGLSKEMLLNDLEYFGFLFEALVIRDLKIYAESIGGKVYHYKHHDTNHELDAVVELNDGRWIAIEVKLGASQIDDAAENLLKINNYFVNNENTSKPSALVVICGLSKAYYKRKDGVIVVPITALKP